MLSNKHIYRTSFILDINVTVFYNLNRDVTLCAHISEDLGAIEVTELID